MPDSYMSGKWTAVNFEGVKEICVILMLDYMCLEVHSHGYILM